MVLSRSEQCSLWLEGPGKIKSRMQCQEMNLKQHRILLHRLLSLFIIFCLQKRSGFMGSRKNKKCVTDKPQPCPALSSISRERRIWIFPKIRIKRPPIQDGIRTGQIAGGACLSAPSAGSGPGSVVTSLKKCGQAHPLPKLSLVKTIYRRQGRGDGHLRIHCK